MKIKQFEQSRFKGRLKELVKGAEALRRDKDAPVEVSLEDYASAALGEDNGAEQESFTLNQILDDLGIDTGVDTIQNLFTLPDDDIRWVVPEIIRSALTLGLRKAPIWADITAQEISITQLKAIMPHIKMSDAAPKKVNEGETIPLGTVSYAQKEVSIFKVGRGISMTYEVMQYVAIDVLNIFLQDFGQKLGYALDVMAIDCLINGEQGDGSESAPVVGVTTANTLVYKDLLRVWIRMARIGRTPDTIIANEDQALVTLDLAEFKNRDSGTPHSTLNLKTPVPKSTNYFIHGNVPANKQIILDSKKALIKFNAQPLLIESEKIVSNQTLATYVSLTTGFAKLFTDAAVIVDQSVTIGASPFPSAMNVNTAENVVIS